MINISESTKSMMRNIIISLFAAVFHIAMTPSSSCAEKLVFAGLASPNFDIAYKVLQEAYEKSGIEIERKTYPILRSLYTARQGTTDGLLLKASGIAEETPELIIVPVPVNHLELVVLTKKIKTPLRNWYDLQPYSIGIFRGVSHAKKQLKKADCISIHEIDSHEQLLKMTQINRIDAALMTKVAATKLVKNSDTTDVKILEPPLENFPVYHYLNKKHADLVPLITKNLTVMQRKGRIEQIRAEILKK